MFKSTGIIKYRDSHAVVLIDPEIVRYYLYFINIKLRKQKHEPHISFVRKENPPNMELWGKYEGKEIEFLYSNIIEFSDPYYFIGVKSEELHNIRVELGLPYARKTRTVFSDPFHITIGNVKEG